MIGLSTSYYAMKGLSIYESVLKTVELGFDVVELGAAHEYEDNVLSTLKKIKEDFSSVSFTVHTLFPPLKEMVWFNPADGLNDINKRIVDSLFEVASIVDASLISIHPPVFTDIKLKGKNSENFHKPVFGKSKDIDISKEKFFQLMTYLSAQSDAKGVRIIIENVNVLNSQFVTTYPCTREEFFELFEMFPATGMLLDVGHALQTGNLHELVKMNGKIFELHLHDIGYKSDNKLAAHFPIRSNNYFAPIIEIIKKDSMVSVFEYYGSKVTEEEILNDKQLLETVLGGET